MRRKQPSLKRRITVSVILLYVFVLLALPALLMWISASNSPDVILMDPVVNKDIAQSIVVTADGLQLLPTDRLDAVLKQWPDFWFLVSDMEGRQFRFGPVPDVYEALQPLFPKLTMGDVRALADAPELHARFEKVEVIGGTYSILSGGGGFVPEWVATGLVIAFLLFWPILLLIVFTIVLVPLLVSRMFSGVVQIERQASAIDFEQRGARLQLAGVPREISGLVVAVNNALERLDAGYEVTQRFFASAAHELRTPIAILQVRIDSLPDGEEKEQLKRDVARLSLMASALLDIERLRQSQPEFTPVDLVALAEKVLGDLAEKAIAQGYEVALDAPFEKVMVDGEPLSLERLLTNLFQNAIQHGGRRGQITVRVLKSGGIEVQDAGDGVPPELVERIFEPFFRVHPHGEGAGLGLKLTRDIAELHGGSVKVYDVEPGGALFYVALPLSTRQAATEKSAQIIPL